MTLEYRLKTKFQDKGHQTIDKMKTPIGFYCVKATSPKKLGEVLKIIQQKEFRNVKWVCNTLEGCFSEGFDGNDCKFCIFLAVQSGFDMFGGYLV